MGAFEKGLEKALWSVAIPGFGQFLNKRYLKGLVLILLEFVINQNAKVNTLIILSFLGETEAAVREANYQWLMFYPCVYIFGIWDAYKDGSGEEKPLLFLPFALTAYLETVGVVYSGVFRIGNILLGPIFLPMACIFIGLILGFFIRFLILKVHPKYKSLNREK